MVEEHACIFGFYAGSHTAFQLKLAHPACINQIPQHLLVVIKDFSYLQALTRIPTFDRNVEVLIKYCSQNYCIKLV